MVRATVPQLLLLCQACHHLWHGGMNLELGTSEELSFWMRQGCADTANRPLPLGGF